MKLNISILLTCITLILNAQSTSTKLFEGVWQSEGYGRIIEIKKNKTLLYDVCKINCNKSEVIPNKQLFSQFKITKTTDSTLVVQDGITKYYLNKIEKLPKLCTVKNNKSKDPLYNFDVLWQTFTEHYCYFKERNIDWNAFKAKYRAKINSNTKPFQLFLVLDEMITALNDGHANMFLSGKFAKDYDKYRQKKQQKRRQQILDSLGQDFKLYPIHTDSTRLITISNYVKDVKTYNYGVLNYGLINSDVALVQINGMEQWANYNIPEGTSEKKAEKLYEKAANKSKNYTQDNANGAAYIMDKVLSEIKGTKACIIDIRFNGGGYDEVQLEILKRFATKDTIAANKKAKNGNTFTAKTPLFVTPTPNAYQGKVFILTSHQTASAAEDFVLCAMAARPDHVRIGSNTEGIFSDILNKKLPNGFEYSLSNEIYESPNGVNYEAVGIAPHYKIQYPKKGYWFYRQFYENKGKKDKAIEMALELINM